MMCSTLSVMDLLLEKQIISFMTDPIEKGSKNKNGRVAALEVYPFTLILQCQGTVKILKIGTPEIITIIVL